MSCTDCTDCTDSTDPCLEDCGCDIEIVSLACIRHDGLDLPCIEVVKGDNLESIVTKINDKLCDLLAGLDGEDGNDGQSVDHASFTGESGTEGQAGQTSTYTLWGDVAETINLGTFLVYNGADGQGIDHASFTSTNGTTPTAGAAGQTDTYTMWADVTELVSLGTFLVYNGADGTGIYDSGWVTINDYNVTDGFGVTPYSTGWTQPKIRVVGKTVFLEGFVMLPLSSVSDGSVLIDDVSTYHDVNNGEVQIYTGASGGFAVSANERLKSVSPIIPQALTPSQSHTISSYEITHRAVQDSGNKNNLILNTVLPHTYLATDGKLRISTLDSIKDDAQATTTIPNSPMHMLVSNVTASPAGLAPNYDIHRTQYEGATAADERQSPQSGATFPADFDGLNASNLGGFQIRLTTSYLLGEGITQTQIEAAIAQITI